MALLVFVPTPFLLCDSRPARLRSTPSQYLIHHLEDNPRSPWVKESNNRNCSKEYSFYKSLILKSPGCRGRKRCSYIKAIFGIGSTSILPRA
ncbi:hypothetical protein TNCV_3373101 [Trichonephila clavipes]|nr:hypothetical protein TNCV_3373101 [Trichonephila clavipes]